MSVKLFDIISKNLYAETGAGKEGISVVPRQQVNNNSFIGGDQSIGGDLFVEGRIIANGIVEMGAGEKNYIIPPMKVDNNLSNYSNYKLTPLGIQK